MQVWRGTFRIMAETGRLRAMEVFWTRDESDVDLSLVHVPGVQDPGNRRPSRPTKVKGRRTQEVKAAVPLTRRPLSESVKLSTKTKSSTQKSVSHKQSTTEQQNHHKPSLKDLCVEDKQRVANLINELARVGEEKNKVAQELNSERIQFEERMKNILTQQERVLQERQGAHVAAVQHQLWECQNLLGRYQRIVSDQQDALNEQVCESPHQDSPRDDSLVEDPTVPPKQPDRRQHRQPSSDVHQQSVSQRQTSPARPQDVPRLPIAGDTAQGSRSSTPTGDVSTISSPRVDQDLTPRGTRRVRVPSLAGSDRPFTAYIDGLIASEQSGSEAPRAGERRSAANRSGDGSSQATSRGKTSSTGPLHEPVLSSTHQSDSLSISQQSRTKAGEFRPLLPDSSPRSSLLSAATHPLDDFSYPTEANDQHPSQAQYGGHSIPNHLQNPHGQGPVYQPGLPGGVFLQQQAPPGSRVTFHSQLHQASPPGPRHPAHQLSDDDFVNYYKSMTPEERQRHLLTQKAALLAEQQRLRQILEDQEQLLHTKQRQLHLQQDLQQERLQHFEQTGFFPPEAGQGQPPPGPTAQQPPDHPGFSLYSDHSGLPHPSRHPIDQGYPRSNQQYMPSGPVGLSQEDDLYRLNQPQPQPPRRPPVMGHEEDPYRLRENPQPPHLRGLNTGREAVSVTIPRTEAESAYPELEPTGNENEITQEEIDAVSDSFENMLFLQRHGIDVGIMNSQNNRKASRPIGPSPVRAAGVSAGRTARPRVETMDDLLNNSRGSSTDTLDRNGKKVVRKTSKLRSSPQQIDNSVHAARLLELVDEVESCSRHPAPPGSRPPRYDPALEDLQPALNEAEGEEEDLEESRILEEVFFVM